MTQTELPYWLQTLVIIGREDDDDKDDDKDSDADKDDEDEDDDQDDKDKDDKGDDDKDSPEKVEADLRAALAKERKLRRTAEREARKASKKASTDKTDKDEKETAEKLQASEQKTAKLAEGFRRNEVEKAVLAEARKLGFIDPTDALISSVLKEVDVDQDEEDPTDVEVDLESVEDAVKELARKKKHLIGEPGSGTGGKSGGKFRKKGNNDDKASDTVLTEHYPSLR